MDKLLYTILIMGWIVFHDAQMDTRIKDLTSELEHVTITHKFEVCIQHTDFGGQIFTPCKEIKNVVPNS